MPHLTASTDRPERFEDWDSRLVTWLRDAIQTPFIWGQFDCALAAADAVYVQTGLDVAQHWRGQYQCPFGAMKALLKRGYRDVYEAASGEFGIVPERGKSLNRGDIAGCVLNGQRTLGVVWAGSLWLPEPEGLRPQPLSLAECGWRLSWA